LLVLASLLALAAANTQWYAQEELSDFHLDSLSSRDCFRGTFGTLSLFTCPLQRVHIEPFAELSSDVKLCVIESRFHLEATRIAASSENVKILYNDQRRYLVLGSSSRDFPAICVSTSDFEGGAAQNVYTVSDHSFRTSVGEELGATTSADARITALLNLVTSPALESLDRALAYGANGTTWVTRNSYAPDALKAVTWIRNTFAATSASVSTYQFRTDMCSNVIAEWRGTTLPNEIVVMGSHADSRGSMVNSTTQVAPGGDDNGSGTAANLRLAQLIESQRLYVDFRRTLRLITFCGEEQGLVGSRAEASRSRSRNENIVAMYNIDMVGWRQNTTTIAFMTGSRNLVLTNNCKNIVREYLPTTAVGDTSACCSDQQAYHENNYPAAGVFETPTSGVVYPYYHTSNDTPEAVKTNNNFDQVTLFAKAIYACTLNAVLNP